jgi:hypothetical protein
MRTMVWLVIGFGLVLGGCSDDDKKEGGADMSTQVDMGADQATDMVIQQDQGPDAGEDMEVVGPQIPAGCNPIAFEHDCLLPYPSDVFRVEDASLPSGKRVAITPVAQVRTRTNDAIDFLQYRAVDGFSHLQPLMTVWPKGVDTSELVGALGDLDMTLLPASKTILLNAETGEPVAHWAEVDKNTDKVDRQAFVVRPAQRLKNGTRYIVALQGLKDASGGAITAPEGFRQLRDAQAAGHPVLGPLATRYDAEIFPKLVAHGVKREELVLAWDFTTISEQNLKADMLEIRADLITRLKATPPPVKIDTIKMPTETEDANIAVRMEGTMDVPLYMTEDKADARLNRDASGKVVANGVAKVHFWINLPRSVIPTDAGFEPVRLMQYGHGFFGRGEEIDYSYMRGFSNEQAYVTAAVDWQGMDEDDQELALQRLSTDPGKSLLFTERVHQGMANQIALSYALQTTIPELDEVKRFDKTLFDKSKIFYYGISQGGILGVTFIALSPQIDRASFSVGGAAFSFMMSRSSSFARFLVFINTIVNRDPLSVQKFAMLAQHPFDFIDPMTWGPELLAPTLPDAPASRKILYQVGRGDDQVPPLSTYMLSRSIGLKVVTPSVFVPDRLEEVAAPADSGLVIVDFGLDPEPGIEPKTVAEANAVHEGLRRDPQIKEQINRFLKPDGKIEDTCGPTGCHAQSN